MRDLMNKWEFHGNDWITAIDTSREKYIFSGSRNGEFFILNWYGALIGSFKLNSWIGAIKCLNTIHSDDIYIFIGTKLGSFIVIKFNAKSNKKEVIYETVFKNTIRDIDLTGKLENIDDLQICIASEDKNIYVIDFNDILLNNTTNAIRNKRVNGWIRSVTFFNDINSNFLIAAGCGDKYLYILAQHNGVLVEKTKVFVGSKIHSVISDKKSHCLYAVSDAKKLYIISPKDQKGKEYIVDKEIHLPHRSPKITFASDDCTEILIICENNRIYSFNTYDKKITREFLLDDKAYSIHGIGNYSSKEMLVGHGQNSLSCFAYSKNSFENTPSDETQIPVLDFDKNNFEDFAHHYLFGKKDFRLEIGIGRFLHLVKNGYNNHTLALVGTDEGILKIFDVERRKLLNIKGVNFGNYRIWSVYGFWRNDKILKLFVSTSTSVIVEYDGSVSGDDCILSEINKISLADWAREIRNVEKDDLSQIIAVCESGQIVFYPEDSFLSFTDNQIFRTVFALKNGDKYEILTGSDNNKITLFENNKLIWQYNVSDRVRETIISGSSFIAVSEDRFLYVINRAGLLNFRFKFPHRALCVELYTIGKEVFYIVGCGDGFVYFVNKHGYVKYSIQFSDRIRDLKIFNDSYLLIACEDRHLYVCPTFDNFIEENYPNDNYRTFISEEVDHIEKQVRKDGLYSIVNLPLATKLVLLENFEIWFNTSNEEIVVTLLDSCRDEIKACQNIRLFYLYASALITVATKIEYSVGKSRIEDYLKSSSNYYIHHSAISTITYHNLIARKRNAQEINTILVIETIVINLDISDEWIKEECVLKLFESNFYLIEKYGFTQFFNQNKINYNRIQEIIDYSSNTSNVEIKTSPLISFLDILKIVYPADELNNVISRLKINDKGIKSLRTSLGLLVEMQQLDNQERLLSINKWVNNILNEATKTIFNESVAFIGEGNNNALVLELTKIKLEKINPLVTTEDYLDICFFSAYLRLF